MTSADSEITDDEPDHVNVFDDIRNRRPAEQFLACLNINSLRHKVIDTRDMLITVHVDILGIAETKLDDTFPNAQFNIDGYRLFRKDRNQHGGGLLAYVRADIPCRQITTLETKSTDLVTLELQINKTKCSIVVAYTPPNVTSHAFTLDMTNLLDRATRDYSDIWVIGELNFDLLGRTKSETLRDVCDVYQLIKEPTNTTIHGSSLIDVILTTVPTKTSLSGSTNVGLSDTHNMIYTTLKLRAPRLPPTTITYRDYKHFREDAYSADVSKIPETVCQIFDDPSDNFCALQLLLTDVINEPRA